jgi:hypothetical protein
MRLSHARNWAIFPRIVPSTKRQESVPKLYQEDAMVATRWETWLIVVSTNKTCIKQIKATFAMFVG